MTERKMNVVMIGCGMVSSAYMDAFARLSDKLQLIGILTSSEQSAKACLDKYNAPCFDQTRAFSDFTEIMNGPEIDFVILTTPPNARLEYVKKCAEANLPLLMEKPIERSVAAATELVSLFQAASVPFGIMLQHRIRPSAQALHQLIATSECGQLNATEIMVPWWREQRYYDEPGRGSYERDGGGVMISQAIHTLDLALQFTGPVKAVTAMSKTTDFHRMESEDFVSAGLEFKAGSFGHLYASTASYPGRTEDIWFHFEAVSMHLLSGKLEVFWQDGRQEILGSDAATGSGADPMAFSSDWHMMMIEDFMTAIETESQPMASGASALEVHSLIEAIERSARKGAKINL